MPAKKTKKTRTAGGDFLKLRLDKVNKILTRLEGEVESLFKRLVRQGERSSRELRRNFDDIISKLRKSDFYAMAQEKTGDFEREVRKLADEVVEKVKGIEFGPSGLSTKRLVKDARKNFDTLVSKIVKSEIFSKAKATAENTRAGILSFLSIPSQSEVEKLEKKIVSLEKRLHHLSQKAA